MKGNKYKHLRGGVRSFTEGFTGILNPGFSQLAEHAIAHGLQDFVFDIVNGTCVPDISSQQPWASRLMGHIVFQKWCENIECASNHINSFSIAVSFDLKRHSKRNVGGDDCMPFKAHAEIVDDRCKIYRCDHDGIAWILK